MLFHQRMIMLQIVDTQWKDHLYSLDHLKEGIGLRGYGQRDPLVEYKKESFAMFQALMDRIDEEILRWVFLYQPVPVRAPEAAAADADEPPVARDAPAGRRRRAGAAPRPPSRDAREPELALAGARAAAPQPDLQRSRARLCPAPAVRRSAARSRRRPRAARRPRCRRSGARARRSAATIRAPAAAGKKYKKCHGA